MAGALPKPRKARHLLAQPLLRSAPLCSIATFALAAPPDSALMTHGFSAAVCHGCEFH